MDKINIISEITKVVVWAVCIYVIPLIKRIYEDKADDKFKKNVDFAVRAAEQLYKCGTVSDRKTYVYNMVKTQAVKLGFDEEALDAIIEAAVFEVNALEKRSGVDIPTIKVEGEPIKYEDVKEPEEVSD